MQRVAKEAGMGSAGFHAGGNATLSLAKFALHGFAFSLFEENFSKRTGLDAVPTAFAASLVDSHKAIVPFDDSLMPAGLETGGILAVVAIFRCEYAFGFPCVLGYFHASEKVRLVAVHGPAGYGAGLATDAFVKIDNHGWS